MKKNTIPKFYLISSIVFFFWIFFKERFYWQGEVLNYYINYYFIAAIYFAFSLVTFKFKKNINQNLLIIFTSIFFSFYLFESYLIYLKHSSIFTKNIKWESPINYYLESKKKDPNITLSIIPRYSLNDRKSNQDSFFPLAGFSNKKTIHCNELGYFSIYDSDRYGFNNNNKSWENEIEFLLVGDSLVHGSCVNESDTISGNFKKIEKTLGVVNLGQGGNGPLLYLATLREYLPTQKIKRILYFHTEGTDIFNLITESNDSRLKKYLENKNYSQDLKNKQKKIDLYLSEYLKKIIEKKITYQGNVNTDLKFFTFDIFKKFIKLYNLRSLIVPKTVPGEFEEILQEIKEISNNINAELYFIYVPDYNRYMGFNNHRFFYNYDKIISIAKENNLNIIDLNLELFGLQKNPKELFARGKPLHLNENGYKLLSEKVLEQIYKFENVD